MNTMSDKGSVAAEGQYLTFRLGPEEYGIDLLKVQEIRSYEKPTHIANAPDSLHGMVDLRGVIVPIIDLRLALNCESAGYGDLTVVIVVNVHGRVIGMVVDSVSEVAALRGGMIHPSPEMPSLVDGPFIIGLGSFDGRMIILIDVEAMLANPGFGLANEAPMTADVKASFAPLPEMMFLDAH